MFYAPKTSQGRITVGDGSIALCQARIEEVKYSKYIMFDALETSQGEIAIGTGAIELGQARFEAKNIMFYAQNELRRNYDR